MSGLAEPPSAGSDPEVRRQFSVTDQYLVGQTLVNPSHGANPSDASLRGLSPLDLPLVEGALDRIRRYPRGFLQNAFSFARLVNDSSRACRKQQRTHPVKSQVRERRGRHGIPPRIRRGQASSM